MNILRTIVPLVAVAISSPAFADNCGKREGLTVSGWGNDWAYVNIDTQLVLTDGNGSPSNNAGYLSVHTGTLLRQLRVCTHENGCMNFGPGESRLIPLGSRYREVHVNVGWCLRS